MDSDDRPVGRVLSRREVMALVGVAGTAMLVPARLRGRPTGGMTPSYGGVLPACVVRPEQTEGPYFVDARLERRDIRPEPTDGATPEGAPLRLRFQVARLDGAACALLAGALVDVWQCDAVGVYSGVRDTNGLFDTSGKAFLRGHQVTGPDGMVEFQTIYPGWYQGRTAHIHFKIRTEPASRRGAEFTSQLYFDDGLSDRVFARAPYVTNTVRRTRNEQDGIFRRQGGRQLVLDVTPEGEGYAAVFEVGLQVG